MSDLGVTAVVVLGFAGATAIPVLVVGILAYAFSAGSRVRVPAVPQGVVEVVGFLARPGTETQYAVRTSPAANGRVVLAGGRLRWAGEDGARSDVPVAAVTVLAVHTVWGFVRPSIDLAIEGTGEWRLAVSDRRINGLVRSTAKNYRESGAARRFAALLIDAGAVDGRHSGP